MSEAGKGSTRRPGDIKPGAWEAIFSKPPRCTRCGGSHVLSECKWPLVADNQASYSNNSNNSTVQNLRGK